MSDAGNTTPLTTIVVQAEWLRKQRFWGVVDPAVSAAIVTPAFTAELYGWYTDSFPENIFRMVPAFLVLFAVSFTLNQGKRRRALRNYIEDDLSKNTGLIDVVINRKLNQFSAENDSETEGEGVTLHHRFHGTLVRINEQTYVATLTD